MRSICVVGVDGTGKSTLVRKLSEWLGSEKSTVQYMGAKNWETDLAKYFYRDKEHVSFFVLVGRYGSLIYDFYKRIYKHKKQNKIIIFDRYINEQVLYLDRNKKSWKQYILKYVYRFVFCFMHKPSITIYLTCDFSISFARKDDINIDDDKNLFLKSKNVLDNYYLSKDGVIVLDTSTISSDEVFLKVKEIVNNEFFKGE